MFGFMIFALFLALPAALVALGRTVFQIYLYSWAVLMIVMALSMVIDAPRFTVEGIVSLVLSSILSLMFTSFVIFIAWLLEQMRQH